MWFKARHQVIVEVTGRWIFIQPQKTSLDADLTIQCGSGEDIAARLRGRNECVKKYGIQRQGVYG